MRFRSLKDLLTVANNDTILHIFSDIVLTAGQQSGSIRLYNYGYSNSSTSGIVEVYYNSAWNTICRLDSYGTQYWGWIEADVACQQLGYTGASSYSYSGATE